MLYQSLAAQGRVQYTTPSDAGATCAPFDYDLKAALAAGDVIELGILPAGARILDMTLVTDKLDSHATPTVALDVGLMSGSVGDTGNRAIGAECFAADPVGKAGGASRMSLKSGFTLPKAQADRSIGVKVNAIATGAPTGRISLLLWYTLA
ncbi:hypothetical protein [Chitinimonas sp. BJB300]|uniref:hypothetical protein n=1 Tax=Chitinimonas sp. BJB300 TaxID=1559339 RepID=UPI000C115676|nr:hypothetical protein [Chitinimonas sp. BJB300]PHV10183.1 hypothetical protein CSQ89_17555 [Chitinimonas sp. BJB300]TSJ83882.1 hypothetical protein FG002_020355 [Chitinimonas sp. BJB300]